MNDASNQQHAAPPMETPPSGDLHDNTRPPLISAPPDVNEVTRVEKIALGLGAFMTLFPLALAAWGAHHIS